MNLSAPFILRPIMTTLVMISVLFAGLMAYHRLPISDMPNVTYPTINVTVTFPGATPETMAHAIALPLEKQFMAIPGVQLVSSNNTLGNTSIVLQFNINKDMTVAAQDVQSAIITATPNLPANLPYAPVYRKVNPAELPIIYICLTSDTVQLSDLYTYGNTVIGQRISMLDGVSQVTTFGSILAVRVQADPGRLAAHDISLSELAQAIALGNAFLPTGQLDGKIEAPNVSVDGQLLNAAAYESLIVAYRNGTPVQIKDIGRAIDNFQNNKIHVQYVAGEEAKPTVLLAIQKEPTANAVEISDNIHKLLESLKVELPAAIDVHTFFDRSKSIRESIVDVNWTLLIALVLVVLVIFIYLGTVRDTIIPAVVLPMSVIGTFIVMDSLNFTLDNLSLLALTLSIGFIVDDAIVVLENIVRRIEEGEDPKIASMEGSRQICFTIVSMTLSLVAVFIPMLFMGGLIGKILREFAITLTAVTLISGIISLTLTPMLCSRFLRPNAKVPKSKFTEWSAKFNQKMHDGYQSILTRVLDHRLTALTIGLFCLLATLFLFYYLPTDFLPDEDIGFFISYTQEREAGSSFSMLDNENAVIKVLMANPAVDAVIAMSSYSEYRKGQNLIQLKPISERAPIRTVIKQLNESLSKIPGIQVFMKNVPLIDLSTGVESRGDYQIAMQSINTDKVYPSAKRLINGMQKDPMFQGVNSDLEIDSPQVNVTIERDKASSLGITATDIENAFNYSYSGNYITRIQTPIDQYQVILEVLPEYQRQASAFDLLWMRSSTSKKLVPLNATATWKEALGASSINHIDQFPSVTIDFNLSEGVSLNEALDRINELKAELVDPSVSLQTIGAASAYEESLQSAGFLLLIAIFTIYIILGMLYESFIHPVTVLTTLPPATLGGLLILWILDIPLSMYAYLGIILLIGIVKKNGIMMVDFALDNIRTLGMTPREAILNASLVRFRPIMMTTFAAIFGALPIALGFGASAASRRPLGIVIIAGLCLSQLITLFITPILYLMLEKVNEKIPWR